jgi:hypothetical protein
MRSRFSSSIRSAAADERGARVVGIDDVLGGVPAEGAVGDLHDLVFAFEDGVDEDAVGGAAVVVADDHVLGDVDELAGHVTGVGGLEGGIGETLAGAVGGDEVLEHREALAEVRENRLLDDVAGGFGHEAADAGQLADLGLVTAGAGVDHEEDGVVFPFALVGFERLEHDARRSGRCNGSRCRRSCCSVRRG